MTKIRANRELCIAAGMCALTAPHLFDQDDESGRVLIRNEDPAGDFDLDAARHAIELCPSGALSLYDDGRQDNRASADG